MNKPRSTSCCALFVVIWTLTGLTGFGSEQCDAQTDSDDTQQLIESDWMRQETVMRGLDCAKREALDGVLARGSSLVDSIRRLGADDAADKLARIRSRTDDASQTDFSTLYLEARWAVRELARANPLLDVERAGGANVVVSEVWLFEVLQEDKETSR